MLRQMPRFQTAFFAAMLLAAPGPAKAESLSPGGQIGPGALGSESGNPLAPGGAAGRAAGRAAVNSVKKSHIFDGIDSIVVFDSVTKLLIISVATVTSSTSTSSTISSSGTAP